MKKRLSILLALSMLLTSLTPAFANETQQTQEITENITTDNTLLTEPFDVTYEDEVDAGLYPYDESTVLVKVKKKAQTLDAEGIASIEYLFKAKDGFWYTANLSEGTTPKTAIETLRNTNGVLLAEYNYLYEAGATTLCDGQGFHEDIHGNPKHPDEWHLDSCGIQHSWHHIKDDCHKNPGGDSGIIVAVIDTGVDYDHEDLKNNMWVNTGEIPGDGIDNDGNGYVDDYYGVDIVAKKGNGDDDHGHGTHVAGIIAAANNNVGVVGVAYNAKIMAIKAGQASGNFLQTNICKAINYARENGADVINMSFGGSASTIAVQDALESAYTHSVLVAAAGNDGKHNEGLLAKPCYPAAYSFVLGVMSVDDFGIESSFTNYDVKGFNDVEYEVYAPGNAITSTIPNNKYATWNGTSMAAPIVSGMAALIRSVYNAPDKYPTKFIYGQLASTSDRTAVCCDPEHHGDHNLPKIVNLYDALTKMPKPEVSVSDYATFDSKSINKANNGDGTIDSGETITLGFELRNRWGMSEDTVVTIDAISQAGIPNPYVEFSSDGKKFGESASVNYGSVGTYSTQDCGKIVENDLFTGWENPFYVKVSKDAPNETILAINVSVKCKNALDESDKNTYSSGTSINLIVKNGVVLPQIIDEDMTLTKDNYYIIQNSTVIEEGATVTVTEGTNIQFWTNDSTDPYADSYMAGLVVKGKLNCVGTEDEHVKIFPSDLMGYYTVEIDTSGSGTVDYKYTDITNLDGSFTTAKNCEFNQTYKANNFYTRRLDGGNVVRSYVYRLYITGKTIEDSSFYKLGLNSNSTYLLAKCKNCIFVDSNICFRNNYTYEDCVFYGNNNYWDSTSSGGTSSMNPQNIYVTNAKMSKREETSGKTYVSVYVTDYNTATKLAEYLGGRLAQIETEEELNFLKKSGLSGTLGAKLNDDGEFVWENGEKLGDFIKVLDSTSTYSHLYLISSGIHKYYLNGYYLIELPDTIRVEEITFAKESVATDTSVTYQLAPQIYPSTASGNKLLYFSSNTDVATVDENGLVTPVSTGTAKIYAFSEDMQVSGSMEIVVKDEVKATSINAPESLRINIGETAELNASVKPKNTTKSAKYSSSDENIATVDADGKITAVAEGEAVITTTVDNGDEVLTAETKVSAVVPVEKIDFSSRMVYVKPGETTSVLPNITPDNATNQNLVWDTSDESICYVNENGEIVGVAEGLATLKATVENTDLSAYLTVCVNDSELTLSEVVQVRIYCYTPTDLYYIINDNGEIWQWGTTENGESNPTLKKMTITCDGEPIEVADIAYSNSNSYSYYYNVLVLDKNGNLYKAYSYKAIDQNTAAEKIAENAVKILDYPYDNYTNSYENAAVIMADGSVMMFGYNNSGMLGIGGSNQYLAEPITVTLDGEKVVDGYMYENGSADGRTYLLTESGNLYVAGKYNKTTYEYFEKIAEGITGIRNDIAYTDTNYADLDTSKNSLFFRTIVQDNMVDNDISIKDGKVYNAYYGRTLDLNNVKNVIPTNNKLFIITESNDLYWANSSFKDGDVPEFITMSPITSEIAPALRENDTNLTDVVYDESGNITSATLKEDKLILGFNGTITGSANYNNITLKKDGSQLGIKKTCDLNNFIVNLGGGFTKDTEYVLTIPAGAIANDASLTNEAITVTFTYSPDETEEPEEETPVTPTDPDDEEEGEQKHVHDFTTETVMPTLTEDGKITNTCECGASNETILPKLTERKSFTEDDYTRLYNEFVEKGYNTNVWNSAILNRLNDTDVTKWLRITAPEGTTKYGFGGNWWGTTNKELINHQIVDYNDFITLGDINEGEILTEAPEDTFPFVTEAYILDESGEVQSVVSGGKVKFVVKFNRDMDTDFGLNVYFGSTYPYGDYQIDGAFTDARTWVGETTLKTVIENGYQFIKVTSGRTAADENGAHLKLYNDWARFGFEIDTTSAMAMMMQGYADNGGIHLEWVQDDYDTLAGYNVYRATSENGNYVRINKTVIPSDENTYYDTDVEPGKQYYYTFTVVLTDVSSESTAAGKISVTAKDTMAPSVYHSPVYTATTGNKVIISATVSDNIGVQSAKLYYRVKGTDEWKIADMTSTNDKYTASIPSSAVTLSGVEYYIAAFDGVNYTYAGGKTSENPYEITVYAAVENNAKGDVDGDGNITVLDALKLLRAIYDNSLLTQEEFLRADINNSGTLEAVEALRILQYANKTISSVLF